MGAIRNVVLDGTLGHSDEDVVRVPLGFPVTISGATYTSVLLANNGVVAFESPSLTAFLDYSPSYPFFVVSPDTGASLPPLGFACRNPMVFAFWADVDTYAQTGVWVAGDVVRYGPATIDGRQAWVANWVNVDYYRSDWSGHVESLNSFQVVIYNNPGGYSFELNYDKILWESGDASGDGLGLGGTSAMMGVAIPRIADITAHDGQGFRWIKGWGIPPTGGPINGSLLDTHPAGLIHDSFHSAGVPGRYCFVNEPVVIEPILVRPDFTAGSPLAVKIPDATDATVTFALTGTKTRPLKLALPDGSWRTYAGSLTGTPLSVKLPDGSWRVVAREGYLPGPPPFQPGVWYDFADCGPAGTAVTTIPARLGPELSHQGSGPLAQVSADAIPALAFTSHTASGGSGYYETAGQGQGSSSRFNGMTSGGVTFFLVLALPRGAAVWNSATDAGISFQYSGGYSDNNNVGLGFQLQDTFAFAPQTGNYRSSFAITVGETANVTRSAFGWSLPGQWLTTGGVQLVEVRYVAGGSNVWTVRIGGVPQPLRGTDTLTGHLLEDFHPTSPNFQAWGTGTIATKLWEYQLFLTGLTGDALTAQRQYYADKYGIPV